MKCFLKVAMCIFAMCLGPCVYSQEASEEIDRYLDSLVSLLPQMPDGVEKLKVLDEISKEHYNVDSTFKYVLMELHMADSLDERLYYASAKKFLGWCYLQIDMYEKSCDCYLESLHLYDSLADMNGLAASYFGLGRAYSALSDDVIADDYYLEALSLYDSLGRYETVTDIYRKLVLLRVEYHLYETISEYIDKAFAYDIQSGDSSALCEDYFIRGWSLYKQYKDFGNPDLLHSAKDEMRKGFEIEQNYNYIYSLYWMVNELMFVYHDLAKIQSGDERALSMDSSRYFYHQADSILDLCSMDPQKIYLRIWNADEFTLKGEMAKALALLDTIESQPGLTWENKYYLYESKAWAYESISDFANAYKYTKLLNKLDKETYNREFGVKITNVGYERALSEQKLLQQKRRYTLLIMGLCFVMVSAIVSVSLFGLLRKRKLNERLIAQNREISLKNEILNESNAKVQAQREAIEAQRDSLEETSLMLQSSINYAKHIQDAAVTSREAMSRMFGDTLVLWKPLNVVSGDFYWAMQHGNLKFVVLADCTGHGVPGAFMSMFAISSLNSIVSPLSFTNIKASEVLDMLRAKIISELHQAKASGDSIDSVDMTFCIIDTDKMLMQYAGANRPLLIVRDGNAIVYKPDKMPVGLHKRNDPFTNHVIDLQKDDVLYMYTDGITDQFGYEDGQDSGVKFSVKRLESLLLSIADKPFAAQGQILDMAITGWRVTPDNAVIEQYDDQLLLGIRIS